MEKRAIVAFILSLVVFVGWGYVLKFVQPQKQVEMAQRDSKLPDAATPSAPAPVAPGAEKPPVVSAPAQTQPQSSVFAGTETRIKVNNGLATYVFTNVDMFADAKRFKKALKGPTA